MSIKKFLKPDWRKILIFFVLFSIGTFYFAFDDIFRCAGCYNTIIGFPINFYEEVIWPRGTERTDFLVLNLIIDIIIFYILSYAIVWLYDRFRKKKGGYMSIENINMIMRQKRKSDTNEKE